MSKIIGNHIFVRSKQKLTAKIPLESAILDDKRSKLIRCRRNHLKWQIPVLFFWPELSDFLPPTSLHLGLPRIGGPHKKHH